MGDGGEQQHSMNLVAICPRATINGLSDKRVTGFTSVKK
jgi:hypothetical protein